MRKKPKLGELSNMVQDLKIMRKNRRASTNIISAAEFDLLEDIVLAVLKELK